MKFTLIERKEEVPGVESFIFDPQASLQWKPGQYLHYTLTHDHADDRGSERWFTIASAPYEGRPMITTRHAAERGSSFKEKLFSLALGESIEADGIEGEFTVEDPRAAYVFLAGGIGITPFHSILKQADHDAVMLDATLIYSNRDDNAPYKRELDSYAANNPKLKMHYLTNPERIDEATILRFVTDIKTPIFYVSGPEPMVKSVAEQLKQMGVHEPHIKIDDFPGYEAEDG